MPLSCPKQLSCNKQFFGVHVKVAKERMVGKNAVQEQSVSRERENLEKQ